MKTQLSTGIRRNKAMLFLATLFALVLNLSVNGQVSLPTRSNNVEIVLSGTSNLHDWTMKGAGFTAAAQFSTKSVSAPQLLSLDDLSFTMPVKSLKSKESLLNSRAYKTLNADQYSQIIFKMSSATVTPQGGNNYLIKAIGNLTISGVTREVVLNASSKLNADGSIQITGSRKMKMSDFGIKPPSFMLGALKTADDINIDFSLLFNRN